jgi:hypothetical protein
MKQRLTLLTAMVFTLVSCTSTSVKQSTSVNQLTINPAMYSAVQAHMQSMVDHQPKNMSMVTETDVALVHEMWRLAGTTKETHPVLYRNLRYAARHDQKHKSGWRTAPYEAQNSLGYTEDIQQITSLTFDNNNIVASAYYSAVRSNLVSGMISLQIWGLNEAGIWSPIADATNAVVDENVCSNIIDLSSTVSLESLGGTKYVAYQAKLLWNAMDNLNRIQAGDLVLTSADVPSHIELIAPRPVKGNDYIKVCMNREDQYGKDCDYVINSELEIVAFPLEGSVTFSGPIWAPGEKPGFDPVVDIKTVKLPSGGGCELTDLENDFWTLPGVTVEGDTVSWNITTQEFQETQKSCFGYGDRALFNMNITAYLKDRKGLSSSVLASFSNNQNTRVGAGTMKMDPMQVYYGCLAEGTEVTLADNIKLNIETDALIGKVVATSPAIQPLLVAGNAYGYEPGYMLKISTEDQRSVMLTQKHPIWVNGDYINAIDTKLFDKVKTSDGEKIVTDLSLVDLSEQPTKVWNIFLERQANNGIAPINERGFYANDILVGDGSVQEYNLLWEANSACRHKTSLQVSNNSVMRMSAELQPVIDSATWDDATNSTTVKWHVLNPSPMLYSYILTARTGNTQINVGEVPSSQLCASFSTRNKPDTVIVTGSDGASPTGKPSSPPTPVVAGLETCP